MELKPRYKHTELGEFPDDWCEKTIGAFEPFVTSGSRGWARYYSKYGDLFVRITNMSRSTIRLNLDDCRFVELPESGHEGSRTHLRVRDILISITADIGITSFVDISVPLPAYINQHIALVRFEPGTAVSKFIAYFLSHEPSQRQFKAITDQGAKAGINLLTVRSIPLVLPPTTAEQQAIADALSEMEALLDSLDRLIAKKRDIKQAAMQQLLTGKKRLPGFGKRPGYKETEVGAIPEDWRIATLRETCTFENGDRGVNYPQSKSFVRSGIPFVNAGHVSEGKIKLNEMNYITLENYNRLGSGKVRPGDILFCLRGSLGKFGIVTDSFGEGAIASSLVIVRSKADAIVREYLSCYFSSALCAQMIDTWAGGAAQPNLGAQDLARFSVLLPPTLAEQHAIATVLSDMDAHIATLEQRRAKTRDLKTGMMQELLTGKTRLIPPGGNDV